MSERRDMGEGEAAAAPGWGEAGGETHAEERGISVEELKHEMFRSLRDTGTIDAIRAQLRRRFIEKLKGHARRAEGGVLHDDADEREHGKWSVEEQVVHGLVYEYLKAHGMEHTLAVFVPEVGGTQQLLGRETIMTMLRLPGAQSDEDKENNQQPASDQKLEPLVLALLKELTRRLATVTMASSTQTVVDCQDHRLALENQLRRVETVYLAECATQRTDSSVKSFEERVLRYQREYDEICEKRLREDMERFKTTELALMRVEERKKYDREIDSLKTTLFQEHRERIQRIQDRERELEVAFASRRSELETNLFEARQQLFQDIEKLRVKQQDLESKHNTEARQIAIEAKRLEILEEKIKLRESNMEATVQAMLEEKEHAWKLEKVRVINEARSREDIVLARERELEDRMTAFKTETEATIQLKEQLARFEVEMMELRAVLAGAEKKIILLEGEKKALQGEIEARDEMLHEDKHNMKSLTYENARMTAELKAAKSEVSKLEDVVVQRISEVKELETEVKELHHQVISLKLSEANAVVEERQRLMKIIEDERDNARWKENDLVGRIRELQTRLAEVEAVSEKYQAQYEDEKVHVEALRHEVSSLQTLLAQAQSAVTMKQPHYSRHVGNRPMSSDMGASDTSERMLMKMMEMMTQMAAMQARPSSVTSPHLPTPSQAMIRQDLDPSVRMSSDDEEKELQKEKERRERELLAEREYQRKRQEREEQDKTELEQRRRAFEEEMERERRQRAKYDEELEMERRKRAAEQEAVLQAELEKQRRAVDEAKEIQRKLLDEQIAREQKRLQEERQLDQEKQQRERGAETDTQHIDKGPSLMPITEFVASPTHEQTTTTDDRMQVPVDRPSISNHAEPTEGVAQEQSSSFPDSTTESSSPIEQGAAEADGASNVDLRSLDGSTENATAELERLPPFSEESRSDGGLTIHNSSELHCDENEVDNGSNEISTPSISTAQAQKDSESDEETKSSLCEEDQPAVVQHDMIKEPLHESTTNDNHNPHEDGRDSSERTEEELEEERRKAADEAKKKEDEEALDGYRQRVLARRAAEKKRQEELEEQKRQEEEARLAARMEAEQASGDELEESDGSFASSAASSSGSF